MDSYILHNIQIQDPFIALEEPNRPSTVDFINTQNTLFKNYIQSSETQRAKILAKITKLYNYPKISCPIKQSNFYYYFQNSGLQPQNTLYKSSSLTSTPETFLDLNSRSDDGTISLSTHSFSHSGLYHAYALSDSGSDWLRVYIRNTTFANPVTDLESTPLQWVKFTTLSWTHDDFGFFYNRYPKPHSDPLNAGTETDSNKYSKIYYHRILTLQDDDKICFEIPENPNHMPSLQVSFDGKFAIVTISESCDPKNKLYISTLDDFDGSQSSMNFLKIIDTFEAEFTYITNDGPIFYFQTTKNAPNRKIVKIDLNNLELGFVDFISETKDVIDDVHVIDNDKLVLVYLIDVKHEMKLFSLSTGLPLGLEKLPLPIGSIVKNITGKREDSELFYSFSSFTSPSTIYRFDFNTMQHEVYRETIIEGLNPSDFFETRQEFFTSKDGTMVPMYIVSKKGIKLDGNNPTLLYGYGGFNISVTPTFSVTWMTFIQHLDGVVVVANIRGGGEYGEKWCNQGKLKNKQNVFDDFQYAAKHLISKGYTTSKKLAINGGSNGGLLVGACINQAPELFGCAVADVGVMDMLKFHKFTIGHAWTSDYGNPDVEEDFEVLRKYSPLHNVNPSAVYPAVLITTGDHDDRVVPLHSLKFLATLQQKLPNNPNPILGRIETKAGHGAGKSTQQYIEEASDKYTFIAMSLDAKWKD